MRDVMNVQPTSGDIRRYQDEESTLAELVNGLTALGLGAAPVNAGHFHTGFF